MKSWSDVCEMIDWDWFYIPGLVVLLTITGAVTGEWWFVLWPIGLAVGVVAIVGPLLLLGIIGGNLLRFVVWVALNAMDRYPWLKMKRKEKKDDN